MLIKDLIFYGFSETEAQYAANNCGENWKANAVIFAKQTLEYDPRSRLSLIKYLHDTEWIAFTEAEATYEADNCGANWNELAVRFAEEIIMYPGITREDLILALEEVEFTNAQAVYAVNKLGL